jgi:putative ATPase
MAHRIPLAVALRPKTFDEIAGQEHLVGKDAKFRKLVESGSLASILLFGPAGTGKTTMAEIIAYHTDLEFVRLNATQASVKDIRKHGNAAKKDDTQIVVFTDEVHRFSKTQQDALLPYVEDGYIIFIGATTENPFHSVNQSLLSRSQMVCELETLKPAHLIYILKRVIIWHKKNGHPIHIKKDAAQRIITVANGDGRKVVSIVEVAVAVAEKFDDAGNLLISLDLVKSVSPSKHMVFGVQAHYDLASAFQGSIQASDPDAAIYWLAKWLESGEDPRYIARRLLVSAAEDACSNPAAISAAHAAYTAACKIGRPECDIPLAQATVITATSPRDKSAAKAIWAAVKDVREGIDIEVPKEMRDCHYSGASQLDHGAYHDGMNQESYVGISKKYYKPL